MISAIDRSGFWAIFKVQNCSACPLKKKQRKVPSGWADEGRLTEGIIEL